MNDECGGIPFSSDGVVSEWMQKQRRHECSAINHDQEDDKQSVWNAGLVRFINYRRGIKLRPKNITH